MQEKIISKLYIHRNQINCAIFLSFFPPVPSVLLYLEVIQFQFLTKFQLFLSRETFCLAVIVINDFFNCLVSINSHLTLDIFSHIFMVIDDKLIDIVFSFIMWGGLSILLAHIALTILVVVLQRIFLCLIPACIVLIYIIIFAHFYQGCK